MHRRPSFEDLHKNHKWAFIDGLLSGLVLVWIANGFVKEKKYLDDLHKS